METESSKINFELNQGSLAWKFTTAPRLGHPKKLVIKIAGACIVASLSKLRFVEPQVSLARWNKSPCQ